MSRRLTVVVLALALGNVLGAVYSHAQSAPNEEIVRRAKNKVEPQYPELARKMNISGTVKIQVTVAPNGSVKDAKIVGGHPLLAQAALDAAKKWRFEPAAADSTGIIDFKFEAR